MTAKELYEKYQADLAELQKQCPHHTASDWMEEQWAPAHGTGYMVRVCEHCGHTVQRKKGYPVYSKTCIDTKMTSFPDLTDSLT